MRCWVGLVGMVVLSGCGAETPSTRDRTVFALEEVARFGSRSGDGSGLTSVASLATTESEVFVLESQPARVAVFSRDGRWLRDVGRAGEGPGELRRPTAIGLREGLLWVGDPRGGRVEFFTLQGDPSRSLRWSLPADTFGAASVPVGVFSDGSILAGPASLPIGAVVRGALTHRSYYKATESGTDPVRLYVESLVPSDFTLAELSAGRFMLGAHPHRQSPMVRAFPDGSGILTVERYAATTAGEASFRVRVVDNRGNVRSDWRVPYHPLSAEGWRDQYLAEMTDDMMERSGSVDRAFLSAIEGSLADLAFYPPATEAVAGSDGSVWLRREAAGADSVRWDVFANDGRPLGSTSLGSELRILRASLDEVWAVELDELDVPFVVRLRVVW